MSLNFLSEHEPRVFHESSITHKRRRRWSFVAGALIVILILIIGGLLAAGNVVAGALDGRDALERARALTLEYEFEEALLELNEAEDSFASARRSLYVLKPLQIIPWVGPQFRGVETILKAGELTAGVLNDLISIVLDASRVVTDTNDLFGSEFIDGKFVSHWAMLPEETRLLLLQRLSATLPELEIAQSEIDLILRDLRQDRRYGQLPLLRGEITNIVSELERLRNGLNTFIQATALLPAIAGSGEESRVLILFLNNTELRPGGGFIGSFAVAKLRAGLLEDIKSYDSLAVDAPVLNERTTIPPGPLKEYLGVDAWFMRDANWSPDFFFSTENVLAFYEEEVEQAGARAQLDYVPFDAVIGVTTDFASDVLRVTGPVTVDNQTFTSQNIAYTLEFVVELGYTEQGIPESQRKEIIGDLMDAVREKMNNFKPAQWNELLDAVGARMTEKHVVLYSSDPDIQQLLDKHNWTGRVSQNPPGDFLMIVDANLAALKSDPSVKRAVHYSFQRDVNGDIIATATMEYSHVKSFDWKTTRYRTFTRFYTPLGSEFISATGTLKDDKIRNPGIEPDEIEITEELGKTVFGMFTSVEPLTNHELSVTYKLPREITQQINDDEYNLLIQKQIGTANYGLTLDLDFDTNLADAIPAEDRTEWGDDRYRVNTILDQDKSFTVAF